MRRVGLTEVGLEGGVHVAPEVGQCNIQKGRFQVLAADFMFANISYGRDVGLGSTIKGLSGGGGLTAGIDMLERRQLSRPDPVNDAPDPSLRAEIRLGKGDSRGRADVLDEFIGRVLVPDDGEDVALGVQGGLYGRHADVARSADD